MPGVDGFNENAKEPVCYRYLSCLGRAVGVIVRHPFGASAAGTNAKATAEAVGAVRALIIDRPDLVGWMPAGIAAGDLALTISRFSGFCWNARQNFHPGELSAGRNRTYEQRCGFPREFTSCANGRSESVSR